MKHVYHKNIQNLYLLIGKGLDHGKSFHMTLEVLLLRTEQSPLSQGSLIPKKYLSVWVFMNSMIHIIFRRYWGRHET